MKPLRIAIDAAPLLMRSAGVKNYLYHWIAALRSAASPTEEIHGFPLLADLGRLHHDASTRSGWSTLWRLAAVHAANRLGPFALEPLLEGAQILHATNQIRQAPKRALLTTTLHDVTAFLMPEIHTRGNVEADRRFAERILCRADGIIAVSENTRADAIRVLNVRPERIATIHSGVADEYFDAQPIRRERPYALFVGSIEPRKNLDTLLNAWKLLKPELRREFDLVIAGPVGWGAQSTLRRIQAEAVYLGYVAESQLPGLTAGASAFVYPSLYEGFGFPVAQAMAAGVPVITSRNSCLPEITAGAGVLVDPRSPSELASGIASVLESPDLRGKLSALGKQAAGRYRWARCARESLGFFRRVAGRV
ncbi:MAG TPA: glycosyltransferase family 1 protein [Bryobacteraceae bacterium]